MAGEILTFEFLQTQTKSIFSLAKLKAQEQIGLEGVSNGAQYLTKTQIRNSLDKFRIIKSQIDKRIGDFSDGIISQPIGNLRKLIDKNKEELARPFG